MGNPWFETVAVAKARSKKRLPRSVYGAIVAGAEAGISRDDNLSAFDQ
ncbi:MAG: alpha-hydroxy-acid oxidizing enzyme, partial [Acidimicrobiaceae bacterium]|nr:alpha-hydroxy-acid oxidizing enzyme [Acidimicrobiaceae bacterium]